MRKYLFGIFAGAAGGAINCLFLAFAPGLQPAVYVSTAVMWLTAGLLISACDFKLPGALKGLLVALLISTPSLIYTIQASPTGAVWTAASAALIGALIGFVLDKLGKKTTRGEDRSEEIKAADQEKENKVL